MTSFKIRNPKIFGIVLLVILTLPLINCEEKPIPQPTGNPCNCTQYDLICTEGVSTCMAVPCQRTDYKDGKCFLYGSIDLPPITQPQRAAVVKLFNLSFTSYEGAVKAGGGPPNKKAQAMIQRDAPSEKVANAVKAMTNDFLYIALGNDFKALTLNGPWGACEIASVPDAAATLALVKALRRGTMTAIAKNNPAAVKAPIAEFFKKYPDYKPNNPGYCYSDKNSGTPGDCIADALQQRLALILGSK